MKVWQSRFNHYSALNSVYLSETQYWHKIALPAKAMFQQTLSLAIWESVKDKPTPYAMWEYIKKTFGKKPYIKVIDNFTRLKNFCFDLSKPEAQIAEFTRLYEKIPSYEGEKLLSKALACMILISTLPLCTGNGKDGIAIDSVYQLFLGVWTEEARDPRTWTLNAMRKGIVQAWKAKFLHVPERDRPAKGTTYFNYDKKGKNSEANKSSAIKPKGSYPQHQQQQQPQQNAPQQQQQGEGGNRCRNCQRGKGGKQQQAQLAIGSSAVKETLMNISPGFQFSLAVQLAHPPPPPPTASTVAHISSAGINTRRQPNLNPHYPTGMHPYKPAHAARRLADRMGVTPTIETLKNFEKIAHIEEVPPSPPALFSRLSSPPPVASSSLLTTEDLHVPTKGDFTMDTNMDGDRDEEMSYSWGEAPLEGNLFEDYGRQVPNDSLLDCTLMCPPPECEGSRLLCKIVYKNKFSYLNHFANCGVCKGKKRANDGDYNVLWIMDSGASSHFSGKSTDFADLKLFSKDKRPKANMANGVAEIQGLGTVFIKHQVTDITARDKMRSKQPEVTIRYGPDADDDDPAGPAPPHNPYEGDDSDYHDDGNQNHPPNPPRTPTPPPRTPSPQREASPPMPPPAPNRNRGRQEREPPREGPRRSTRERNPPQKKPGNNYPRGTLQDKDPTHGIPL
ncbi:hypothetical protein CPB83DRAFT_889439 [Crepidotus variabilis]|uniref:Uncharacterized protein n=1 Tax=Crepidotus variabilis TaxID=179855 RepID=A0A9P6JUM2_9AGAR|nr:hypothetical protein CPB83DRAFT_889439 [Crepidotus variabilis]